MSKTLSKCKYLAHNTIRKKRIKMKKILKWRELFENLIKLCC